MHNFKELKVWEKSKDLTVEVHKLLQSLSSKDNYIFSDQLLRCAMSIPSNIAEGAGKNTDKDFCNFLNIATGSSFELETQLLILKDMFLNLKEKIELLLEKVKEIQKMLHGLKKSLNIPTESKSKKVKLKAPPQS